MALSILRVLIALLLVKNVIGENSVESRIYGGQEAKPGQFPFIVSIRLGINVHECGGSILSERWIVTAAHCIEFRTPDYQKVLVGVHRRGRDPNATVMQVKSLVVHEGFDREKVIHDIGLVELEQPINFTLKIAPIELNKSFINETLDVYTAGWGKTDDRSWNLKYAKMFTMSNYECRARHDTIVPIFDYGTICAYSGRVGAGLCSGDSGGPLIYNNTLIGIASWVVPCGLGFPDGFTRISEYASWIEKHIRN